MERSTLIWSELATVSVSALERQAQWDPIGPVLRRTSCRRHVAAADEEPPPSSKLPPGHGSIRFFG